MVTRQEFIDKVNNASGITSSNNDFMEEDLGAGDQNMAAVSKPIVGAAQNPNVVPTSKAT